MNILSAKIDWILIGAIGFLISVGLLMMVSLGLRAEDPLFWFWRQLIWVGLAAGVMMVVANFDYRIFRHATSAVLAVYFLALLLLVATLIWGVRINGAQSWLAFGNMLFQPVEVAKIALILVLAKYYATKNIELWRFRHILITGVYLFALLALVMAQPDLGSAVILFAIWFGMTVVSGIRRRQFFILLGMMIVGMVLLWNFGLNDIQKNRVLAVVQPEAVSAAALYNTRQAVIAVGAGGLWGAGLGQGSQAQLGFLPAARTDFVFAAMVQEMGIIGATFVLGAIGVALWRISSIAVLAANNFAKLFAMGFFMMFASHAFVNIAMNLGVFPIIGISLPFMSYGGSNLLANFIGLGILLSIKRRSVAAA